MRAASIVGFTLIELLVVLGVVALLAALLFPTFSKSKEKAKRTWCLNNVRQHGVALRLYADDHNDLLPDATTNNPSFFGSWWPWDLNTNLVANLELNGATRKVLYCPSNQSMNDDRHWNFWNYYPPKNTRVIGYIFLLNGGVMIPQDIQRARVNYADAPKMELVADAVASTRGDYTRIQGMILDRTSHLQGRTPAGGNILFGDGHAAWRHFKNMKHRIPVDVGVIWDF